LHVSKDAGQSGDQLGLAGEVAIVGSILSRVLPQPVGGVELRRVRGQLVHFEPWSIRLEPAPHLGILVIGGVVLNENGTAAAIVGGELIKEGQVGGSIKDGILLVMEAGMPEFDGAQDLHTLALPEDGDFGRAADPAPGGVQRGILPKTGFIGEDQGPVLRLGFF
jgi:hypothetical protein